MLLYYRNNHQIHIYYILQRDHKEALLRLPLQLNLCGLFPSYNLSSQIFLLDLQLKNLRRH